MLHIEFIGTPGSGKSTLCTLLSDRARDRLCSLSEMLFTAMKTTGRDHPSDDVVWRRLLSLIPRPLAVRYIGPIFDRSCFSTFAQARFLADHAELMEVICAASGYKALVPDERAYAIRHFLRVASAWQIIDRAVDEQAAVVFDEGFLQRATTLFFPVLNIDAGLQDLPGYVAQVPRPDVVIHVSAPIEICLSRLADRGFPDRLRGRSTSEQEEFLRACHDGFRRIADQIESRGSHVIRIDNDRPVEEVIEKLMTAVDRVKTR